MTERRPHPLFIIINTRRFLWLLIIPLARGFIAALQARSLAAWFGGVGFDIALLLLILAFSAADWMSFRYIATDEGVEFRRGLLRRRRTYLPVVAAYTVEEPFVYRLVGAVRLWADTPAGRYSRSDFSVIARKSEALELIGRPTERGHRPSAGEVAVMSFVASNAPAGILILVAAVRGAGQILGDEFQQMIFGHFQQLSAILAFGIPPAAAAIGYLMLAGWLLAFFYNFLRFWDFKAARQGDDLLISCGLLFTKRQRVSAPSVSFLDIRRNLPSVLLRLYTVLVMAPGMDGKPSVIVPAAGAAATEQLVERLMPRLRPDEPQIHPAKNSFIRYYSEPIMHMLYIVVASIVLRRAFPGWSDIIVYLAAMAALVPIWGLAIRAADLRSAGAARAPEKFTLRYSTYFYLHTAVVRRGSIVSVKIQQTPIQRFTGVCDIIVQTCVEHKFTTHRLRQYNLSEAERFFDS